MNVVIAKGLPGDSGLRPSIYCRRKRLNITNRNMLGPIPTNKVRFLKAGTKWSPVAKAYDATPDFDLSLLGASRDLLTTRL